MTVETLKQAIAANEAGKVADIIATLGIDALDIDTLELAFIYVERAWYKTHNLAFYNLSTELLFWWTQRSFNTSEVL